VTRAELYGLLDQRMREPSRADEIEASIWSACGCERAILVSDLSGFTRITKQKGILHFLCAFRSVVQAGEALFREHGALFWKTDADNLMATFPDVAAAAAVALALARSDFGEVGCCLGLGFGRILQLEDDLFGDEVNVTYKLGEDVAEPGQVLVSEPAARRLDGAALGGPETLRIGTLALPYYRLLEVKTFR